MPSPAALLVVPNGRATTAWQHVIRALGRERPTGRLYVLFQTGGEAPNRHLVSLATRAFQAVAAEAPRLDLVPLFPTCGWSLHAAAVLADVASVLVAPHGRDRAEAGPLDACDDDVAEHWDEGAGTGDESVLAAVQAARTAVGLPHLPVHPLPPPPPKRGPLPPVYPGSTAPEARHGGSDVAAQGSGGRIAQNGAHGAASHQDADHDGGDGSGQEAASWCYDAVAVGGTFDRLHGGHRLLLCIAAAACAPGQGSRLFLGVTVDELLRTKRMHHLVEPLQQRTAAAVAFIAAVAPQLRVETSALTGSPPKAVTFEAMQALVVSRETMAGAKAVQQQRLECGFPPLAVLCVDLVGATSQEPLARKLSSSGLRELEAAALLAGSGGGGDNGAGGHAQQRLPSTAEDAA